MSSLSLVDKDQLRIYSNEITYNQPIQAVHEMEDSGLDTVPFLPKDGPQPKIVLLEDFHNFGRVGPTNVVRHEFVIANQGEAPLTISRGLFHLRLQQ